MLDLLAILDLELLRVKILVPFLLDAFIYFVFVLEFQDRLFNQSIKIISILVYQHLVSQNLDLD